MPTLKIEVTESTLQALRLEARARVVKPENVAAAAVEDFVRQSVLLDRRFRDAIVEVNRRLSHVA